MIVLLGVNHRTAPLALRERLAVAPGRLTEVLAELRAGSCVQEAVILSTCNRVECYLVSSDPIHALRHAREILSHHSQLPPSAFEAQSYQLADDEAVAHLFRVAAGLDSMVLGESEIAAQVKQAYQAAHAAGATGPVLNRLFQKALHSAKTTRSRTGIAQGQASIGSVVVTLAKQVFGDGLGGCSVLLWGAGKAAEVTARHLIKSGVRRLSIVNRTSVKAQDLALACQGGWLSWEEATRHLAQVDIAIVCTQAPHFVVDQADIASIWPKRAGRPLCLVDLAVPRNVDPSLRGWPGLHLHDIDDLYAIARGALAKRRQEREQCEALIAEQVQRFRHRSPSRHEEVSACPIAG